MAKRICRPIALLPSDSKSAMSTPVTHALHLTTIPMDLQAHICRFLPAKDKLLHWSLVCKTWNHVARDGIRCWLRNAPLFLEGAEYLLRCLLGEGAAVLPTDRTADDPGREKQMIQLGRMLDTERQPDDLREEMFELAAETGRVHTVRAFFPTVGTIEQEQTLVSVCARGRTAVVEYLVYEAKMDVEDIGLECVTNATSGGHARITEMLINHPDIDISGAIGRPILRDACFDGHTETVRVLVAHPDIDPWPRGSWPFRRACVGNQPAVIRLLLSLLPTGSQYNEVILACAQDSITAHQSHVTGAILTYPGIRIQALSLLLPLVQVGLWEPAAMQVAEAILAHPSARFGRLVPSPSVDIYQALLYMCTDGTTVGSGAHTELAEMLMSHPRAFAGRDDSKLLRAAFNSKLYGMFKILMTHPDINPSCNRNSILLRAIQRRDWRTFDLLVASDRLRPELDENLPLCRLIETGNLARIKQLVVHPHLSVSACDSVAIRWAAASERTTKEIMAFLLQQPGIDVSFDHDAALVSATSLGAEVVQLLLDHKANPCSRENAALCNAIRHNNHAVVLVLLNDNRLDPSTNGQMALRVANERGLLDMVQLLLRDHRVDAAPIKSTLLQTAKEHLLHQSTTGMMLGQIYASATSQCDYPSLINLWSQPTRG